MSGLAKESENTAERAAMESPSFKSSADAITELWNDTSWMKIASYNK